MYSSDSGSSDISSYRSRSRSRSRSLSPTRTKSQYTMTDTPVLVNQSTITDKRRRRSPRGKKRHLVRHLAKNKDKFINTIKDYETVIWVEHEDPFENYRNLPSKPVCKGIRQICRYKDPVTRKYISVPDDGSEDDEYDINILLKKAKERKKKCKKDARKELHKKSKNV